MPLGGPFSPPHVGRRASVQEDKSLRAGASQLSLSEDDHGMTDGGNAIPEPDESDLQARSYHSCPETATRPTEQRLLEAMYVMGPYQIDLNGRACAARIGRFQQSVASYEQAERALPWNPQHRGIHPIANGNAEVEHNPSRHINIQCDWEIGLGRGAPELLLWLELFRSVAIGDCPFLISKYRGGFVSA